ncbi:MAG: hypothetical protein ABJC89_19775 [Acidobacteriota bacterium]
MNPLTAPARPVRPRSFRRLLTGGLLTVVLAVGMVAATATPAEAASYFRGCFAYYQGGNLAGTPVQIEVYLFGYGWYPVATATLPVNGCVQVTIPPSLSDYYWKMSMNYRPAGNTGLIFFGSTPYYASPGPLTYDLGTAVVYCYGCHSQ